MRVFQRLVLPRSRHLVVAMTVGLALTSSVVGAQEIEKWWDPAAASQSDLPEKIIKLQRESEAAERVEATDVLRKQFYRNARKWEETQRGHDRKLTEVFAAADENARNTAKWQRRVQVLQFVGATLSFVNAIRGPSPEPAEPIGIAEDDLDGQEIVLCEESECVGISFSEALGALETAGTPETGGGEISQTLIELREELASMVPVRCSVELGECDTGEGPTREPAWVLPFAHALRTTGMRLQSVFPRAIPRLKSLGRAASRLIQRSGARSKQIVKKWDQHAVEFRKDGLATTRDGYARLVEHYMKRPHGTYRIKHPDGRTLIYDPIKNVFTSFRGDKFITMFRSREKLAYWLREARNATLYGKGKSGTSAQTIKLGPWPQKVLQPKTLTWEQLPAKVRKELVRYDRSTR